MKTQKSRISVLILELALPIVVFFIFSNYIIGSSFILDWMDRYRPALGNITTMTHVESQYLHAEADSKLNRIEGKVVFMGSSSVVNGIDKNIIQLVWREIGYQGVPVNYGQTGFMAYEMPFMKNMALTPDVKATVFLYNTFCFSDIVHPQAASVRFNAYEFLVGRIWRRADREQLFKGLMGQLLFVVRYLGVVKTLVSRAVWGRNKKRAYDYDQAPGLPRPGKRKRIIEKPAHHWLRAAYWTSAQSFDTISYNGFIRFLRLARRKNIKVMVAPIPVPDFAATNRYRVGLNHGKIDARVEAITSQFNYLFLDRTLIRHIEVDDTLFYDRIHLHDLGREIYSDWLARRLPGLIGDSK